MIYLQITAGRGPVECNEAVRRVTNKILTDGTGIDLVSPLPESSIVRLDGDGAVEFARAWIGTVLWVCRLRQGKARKNWFVGVREIDVPDPKKIEIRDEHLKWETKRTSGKGGQHVNKTESAVRVTYLPLGISVIAEDERSQHRNRAIALERLRQKIKELDAQQVAVTIAANWYQHNRVERGNPVRIFEGLDFVERIGEGARRAKRQ